MVDNVLAMGGRMRTYLAAASPGLLMVNGNSVCSASNIMRRRGIPLTYINEQLIQIK
jgi:hypothetical protein